MQDQMIPQESVMNSSGGETAVPPPSLTASSDETIPITNGLALSNREETSSQTTPMPGEESFDTLHSLTRLLVGGVLEGSAELAERLKDWETYLREETEARTASTQEEPADLARYALIGLLFESENRARRGLSLAWKAQKRLAKTAVHLSRPVANSRLLSPMQRHLDRAAERGQAEILRWIARGKQEEPISRDLARLAFGEVVDEFIEHLAQNNEVQELVQQQSVGLATEVVDQVRQRTFTADTLVERIARAVTRRPPRLTPPLADLSEMDGAPTNAPENK